MSKKKREVQLKADISSTVSDDENDQGGINISSVTTEKTIQKDAKVKKGRAIYAFFQRTWKAVKNSFQKNRLEPMGISAEPEVDPADAEQLCLPGPSGPVTLESTQKREVQLKSDIISKNDQDGMNISTKSIEKTSPQVNKTGKIFFGRRWKAMKKGFQKNRVEPFGVPAQPDPEPLCVPGPEPEPKVDFADAQQLCVSAPSGPEPQVTAKTQETQGKTELSALHSYFLEDIFQLERRMRRCKVHWTPATEVWPNVFIGNEETAMDQDKLKEMGISHILNTAAYKEYMQGKIDIRAEYYKEMDISYYGVLVKDDNRFDISNNLFPATEFIHKALSNTENKLLVHCIDGVSRSATYFLAYLMIHQKILLEDAIDHIIDKRWIRPNRDFLKELTILNLKLKYQ